NTHTGQSFTWRSNNTAVATVSAGGLVTAVAAGSATISATSGGITGTAAVTVTAPATATVASVTVSPATGGVDVGSTMQLAAVAKDAGGNPISGPTFTWTSNNKGVATVSASGLVTGVKAGSANFKATTAWNVGSA